MFEKFLSTNAGDFRQRYLNTYGFYSRGGKRKLVQLSDINIDRHTLRFIDVNGADFSLNADAEEDVGFEFLFPTPCWHNTAKGPMLVRRIAQRQYQRGISDSNTEITLASQAAMMRTPVTFAVLQAIFENPITVKEAAKAGNYAVSDQFMVGTTRMWVYNQAIGDITRVAGTTSVKLHDPTMFVTEVTDAFRRAGIEAKVE